MKKDIPLFIKLRGCINCEMSKRHKQETGKEYGFNHELVGRCLLGGCLNHGVALYEPFLDPEEIMKRARKSGNKVYMENARIYTERVKARFGHFYEAIGIDLSKI